jgi:hypothetical protein
MDPKIAPKDLLEAGFKAHRASGKVIEEKEIALGKVPGRSLVVETSKHRKWMRTYLAADKTQYSLNCGGPVDRAATDEKIAVKVLDSFKL